MEKLFIDYIIKDLENIESKLNIINENWKNNTESQNKKITDILYNIILKYNTNVNNSNDILLDNSDEQIIKKHRKEDIVPD